MDVIWAPYLFQRPLWHRGNRTEGNHPTGRTGRSGVEERPVQREGLPRVRGVLEHPTPVGLWYLGLWLTDVPLASTGSQFSSVGSKPGVPYLGRNGVRGRLLIWNILRNICTYFRLVFVSYSCSPLLILSPDGPRVLSA